MARKLVSQVSYLFLHFNESSLRRYKWSAYSQSKISPMMWWNESPCSFGKWQI